MGSNADAIAAFVTNVTSLSELLSPILVEMLIIMDQSATPAILGSKCVLFLKHLNLCSLLIPDRLYMPNRPGRNRPKCHLLRRALPIWIFDLLQSFFLCLNRRECYSETHLISRASSSFVFSLLFRTSFSKIVRRRPCGLCTVLADVHRTIDAMWFSSMWSDRLFFIPSVPPGCNFILLGFPTILVHFLQRKERERKGS